MKLNQSSCTTPGLSTCHTVELPTGATYEFETTFRNVQALRLHRLRRIVDKFGHYVQIDYDGTTKDWTVHDSVGRSHTVEVSVDPYVLGFERIDAVKLAAFNGTEATWTFNYDPAGFSLALPGSIPPQNATFSQLDGITLPDGNEFGFSYDATFNISQVDLPTGGHYSYQYGGWNLGPQAPPGEPTFPFLRAVVGVTTRTENDGTNDATWTYDHPTIVGFPYHQTNVVTPEGDLTVHYFSTETPTSGLPMAYCGMDDCFDAPATAEDTTSSGGTVYLSRQEYEGSSAIVDQLRRSVYLAYTGNSQFTDGNGNAAFARFRAPRIVVEKTIFHDDSAGVAETFYEDYDGLGHHRFVRLEGTFFGSTQDHWNKRLTTTDHNSNSSLDCPWGFQTACTGTAVLPAVGSPWLLELLSDSRTKVWKNNSGGTQTFIQKMCFDSATGFLEGRRSLAGSGLSARDVLQVFTEGTGATVGFVVKEESFGGDISNDLLATGDPCTPGTAAAEYSFDLAYQDAGLATRRATGSTVLLTDQTIDLNTGATSTSRDSAGVETEFDYDSMGRLVTAQTSGVGVGNDACSVVEYLQPTASLPARIVTSTRSTCTSTTLLTRSETRYDGLGRKVEQRQVMPGGSTSKRTMSYTGSGWPQHTSELETSPTLVNSTRYANYDRYGRPGQIQGSDESVVTFVYEGAQRVSKTYSIVRMASDPDFANWNASDVSFYTPTNSSYTRTERYDRFGRLKQVQESADPFDNSIEPRATYFYAPGDQLDRVKLAELNTGTRGTAAEQERFMTYDGRGFLVSENHPEIINNTPASADLAYKYDSRGNLREKTDGNRILEYTYDSLGRAVDVKVKNGAIIKSFTYYGQNSGSEKRKGKLKTATRNSVVSDGTASVVETYIYLGRAGRISQRSTLVNLPGNWAVPFTQGFTWDELGNLDTITYPCRASLVDPDVCLGPTRVVNHTYDRGFLIAIGDASAGIGDYVSEIAYHDNGMYKHSVFDGYQGSDDPGNIADVRVSQGKDPAGMPRPGSVKFETSPTGQETWATGADFPLSYDGVGNVASFNAEEYFYDPAGRLQAVKSNPDLIQDYDYDLFGNRTAVRTIEDNGATLIEEFEPTSLVTNRLLKPGFSFDEAGNVLSRPGVSYVWDDLDMVEHQVNGAATTYFLYTADDERIGTELPLGGGFAWCIRDLGGRVLREFSSSETAAVIFSDDFESGNLNNWDCVSGVGSCEESRGGATSTALPVTWVSDLVHRGGNHEITVEPGESGEERMAFVRDYLGTARLIFRESGGPTAYYFLPFGRQVTPSPTGTASVEPRLRYTNHERDVGIETDVLDDLDYMRARFCSPIEGRFLSVDPVPRIGISQGRPQLFNRYSYTGNNPVSLVDPSGEFIKLPNCEAGGPCKELNLIKHTLSVAGASDVAAMIRLGEDGKLVSLPGHLTLSLNKTVQRIASAINAQDFTIQLLFGGGLEERSGAKVKNGVITIDPALATSARFMMKITANDQFVTEVAMPLTIDEVFMHEFGHAFVQLNMRSSTSLIRHVARSNEMAITYENDHRQQKNQTRFVIRRPTHNECIGCGKQ